MRSAPNSTYKIYDALFALDAGIISSEASTLPWDKPLSFLKPGIRIRPCSLPWPPRSTGVSRLWTGSLEGKHFNPISIPSDMATKTIRGALSSYWMESSLKISPAEQVALLVSLYQNDLPFALEHIQAVKDALFLSASGSNALYGKTGTGAVNGQDVNGWFVGFVEAKTTPAFLRQISTQRMTPPEALLLRSLCLFSLRFRYGNSLFFLSARHQAGVCHAAPPCFPADTILFDTYCTSFFSSGLTTTSWTYTLESPCIGKHRTPEVIVPSLFSVKSNTSG